MVVDNSDPVAFHGQEVLICLTLSIYSWYRAQIGNRAKIGTVNQ